MAIHNGDIFPIIRTRANFKDWCPRSESKDLLNVVISGGTQIYISEPRRTGKTIFVNSTLMENDNVISNADKRNKASGNRTIASTLFINVLFIKPHKKYQLKSQSGVLSIHHPFSKNSLNKRKY